MSKQKGIKVNGGFFNEDGTDLSWELFIEKIESVKLSYSGQSLPIDDEGNMVDDQIYPYNEKQKGIEIELSNVSNMLVSQSGLFGCTLEIAWDTYIHQFIKDQFSFKEVNEYIQEKIRLGKTL